MKDPTKIASKELNDIRNDMATLRSRIINFYLDGGCPKDNIDHVEGMLTCGIVTLHHNIEDLRELEINKLDRLKGKSIYFSPRGIGIDDVSYCFISGEKSRWYHNIAAFVKTKEQGEEIVSWFNGAARLDFRESEPNRIQVKVGVINKHFPGLQKLHTLTHDYSRIRQCDIKEAIEYGLANTR